MSRIAAIRSGDRDAFRAMLEERGAMLDVLVQRLTEIARAHQTEPGLADVAELCHSLWRARLMAEEEMEEVPFIAAFGFFKLAPPSKSGSTPHLDFPAFYQLVGRVLGGAGDQLDAQILATQSEQNAQLAKLRDDLAHALKAALNTPAGPPSEFSTWWPSLEARIAPGGSDSAKRS